MTDDKRRSIDIEEDRLDLDSPEAFDPTVDLGAFGRPSRGAAGGPAQSASTGVKADDAGSGDGGSDRAGFAEPGAAEAAKEIEELRRERDRLHDRLLRQAAEFDNYRKRVERERRDQADETVAQLLREIVAVVDDFELALRKGGEAEGGASAAYRQGVELIHKQLLELLRKRGVRPIDAVGTDFDPHVHQAVTQEESASHRDGEVMEEFRKGYMLGDRLLRPSMVKVARSS